MNTLVVVLSWFSFVLSERVDSDTQFPTRRNGDQLTNLLVNESIIYVAENGMIHKLNKDLTYIGNFSTCDGNDCDNINKVLALSDDLLILCGTGSDGVCQAWNGNKFVYNSSSVEEQPNYLVASTDPGLPAVGLVYESNFFLGVTFGAGIEESEIGITKKTYKYLVSRSDVLQNFSPLAYAYLKDMIYLQYKVYFKSIFRHENFIYILSNQKIDATVNSHYVSKLIRICINETYQGRGIKSYTDVVLSCDAEGVNYNLVQDAVFLPSTKVLVAGFSKGLKPESPEQQSAVCVYTLDAVTSAIVNAKESFITCKYMDNTAGEHLYLPKDLNSCLTNGEYDKLKDDFVCPGLEQIAVKVTSNTTIHQKSALKISDTDARITRINGIERYGQYPDIVYGTDRGSFGKITIAQNHVMHEYQNMMDIDNHPVTGIHIPEDGNMLYILTTRKLFRHITTGCSTYSSCEETMIGKDPTCGWCVSESRSSNKSDCTGISNGWLSSLSACISMTISPKSFEARLGVANISIEMSNNFPIDISPSELRCRLTKSGVAIGSTFTVTGSGRNLKCTIVLINEHVDLSLLVVFPSSNEKPVAESRLQLYKCDKFTNCEMCRSSSDIACQWCGASLTCQNKESACNGNLITVQENSSMCPRIFENQNLYVPAGVQTRIILDGANLIFNVDEVKHKCVITVNKTSQSTVDFDAVVSSSTVTCDIEVSSDVDADKKNFPITVIQVLGSRRVEIKQEKLHEVTVYNCENLGRDCTTCNMLNSSRYECNWCKNEEKCLLNATCERTACPLPQIKTVEPAAGGYKGNTKLRIKGYDLGFDRNEINKVLVGNSECKDVKVRLKDNPDFRPFIIEILCKLDRKTYQQGGVNVTVRYQLHGDRIGVNIYSFKNPKVTSLDPKLGTVSGGTEITLFGSDLDIGNVIDDVRMGTVLACENPKYVYQNTIECTTEIHISDEDTEPDQSTEIKINYVRLKIDDQKYDSDELEFTFRGAPKIDEHPTLNSIMSGGIKMEFSGVNLNYTAKKKMYAKYGKQKTEINCSSNKSTSLVCRSPKPPPAVLEDLKNNMGSRRKRSVPADSIAVQILIKLDGYEKEFSMNYFRDPEFYDFIEEGSTRLFKSDDQELTIQGDYINLVGTEEDYRVYIGPSSECKHIVVTETNLTCRPPQIDDQATPPVTVVIGNLNATVGYVKYVKVEVPSEKLLMIILPVVGGVLLVFLVFLLIGFIKYRRVKGKAMKFERSLADMELQIKKVFREEFLDMHTTMSRVNESLIEKGFPYNNYQRYCFLMMFPGEWNMEEHPLMHEPVVSDHIRGKLKQGMDQFDELLKNKFFLVSIVLTMEKQKKFFLKEKSNMAGHLSVALLGKMEYVHEILTKLLTNLVDDTPAKSQKTLFRRCESITEKLLSNWLVLSLYPHVKLHSGSPLYMLLKGTQLTMESGPIDALTGDSKYTLSEDKLLRQDDKPNTLTLKIMVDNSDEIRDCKVLDCDTISQVKAKCLSQIYVNYPASQLTVESSDLNLEWHWGTGGRLMIQDEDTTSKREGQWLRLNTLEHYRVTDGSSMALVDPHGLEQEDYVNLANIRIDTGDPGCNGSVHSNDPLTPPDEESGLIERWHLVKPDTDQQKPESFVVEELYLNRLITTKQSVLEYMKNLFDTILSSTVPPPTKFLFDFLDELGEKNKVEPDTLHAWKSQCYTIRFWATLINKPYNLFDQRIPSYVETSMEVISQVLIESCSLKAPEYTKDSSPGKLIFKKDMVDYRDKVKQYYTQVKTANQDSEDLRLYLKDLNKFQQQQLSFNRQAALYSLYAQLQPYMDEIMEDLENNEETKSLHLDRKLANLNNFMQDD